MFFSLVIVFIIFFLLYGYFAAKSEAKKKPDNPTTAVPNTQEVLACSELPSSSKTPKG